MKNNQFEHKYGIKNRRNLILLLSSLPIFFSLILPVPANLTRSGLEVIGVFITGLIMWITLAIDWPSLIVILGLCLIPELSPNKVLAASFGNSTVAFLIFTFICTAALADTGILKKMAIVAVKNSWASKSGKHFLTLYLISVLGLGLFLSPTILFMVYLPFHKELCKVLQLQQGDKLATAMMVGQTFTCALASGITPIAHVFPILALNFYTEYCGAVISYWQYMLIALPVGLAAFAILLFGLIFWLGNESTLITAGWQNIDWQAQLASDDFKLKFSAREKKIAGIFVAVVLMWLLPEAFKSVFPDIYKFFHNLGMAVPPLLGATAMFIFTDEQKPLLDFKTAVTKGISWGSILMCAATLAIGMAMKNESLQISDFLSMEFTKLTAEMPAFFLLLLIVLWTGLQTNFTSNIVTVGIVSAVALPLVTGTTAINPATVACFIGMLASFSFAAPSSHPNVAIAAGSGYVSAGRLMRWGLLYILVITVLMMTLGYSLATVIL